MTLVTLKPGTYQIHVGPGSLEISKVGTSDEVTLIINQRPVPSTAPPEGR